ncbi:MAG: dioxygenase [Verrucomicrobiae bacterium]|nr:dioxygenase [Verrucomicrobiae bacterium]MCP5539481.1 dioxygenase [Akkermansiaceae bacterium]MCP5551699.1 dioxygenase [Akkermansiaceae bacterium]
MSKKTTASEPTGCHLPPPDQVLLDGARHTPRYDPPTAEPHYTVISYDGLTRLALMVTPTCGGKFVDQAWETLSIVRQILRQQGEPMALTMQTVFVADANDVPAAQKLFEAYFGEEMPLTLFVVQPPCDGAALAVEAWAISTRTVEVGYLGPHLVTLEHDGMRWVYASSGAIHLAGRSAYEQAREGFVSLRRRLRAAGVPFRDVARLWLYQGGITEIEEGIERYRELNRGRTDVFEEIDFASNPLARLSGGREIYPASTGIGTKEHGLVMTSLAVQTDRDDVAILALENPRQVSAFDYPPEYSKKSPKFARAMGIRIGNHLTTWVSGTASIIDSETVHPGDVVGQTEQTLDNIANLISRENYARHGWADAGATLSDLAKARIYVKRPEDYEKCREVCQRRLGSIPTVYAVADVCRPDLLVEIEAVAFSSLGPPPAGNAGNGRKKP